MKKSIADLKNEGKVQLDNSLDSYWHKDERILASNVEKLNELLDLTSTNPYPPTFNYYTVAGNGQIVKPEELFEALKATEEYQRLVAKCVDFDIDYDFHMCLNFIIKAENGSCYVEYKGTPTNPEVMYPVVDFQRLQANEFAIVHMHIYKETTTGYPYTVWSPIEKFKTL